MIRNNPGLTIATVTDNQDPDGFGRVQVSTEILGKPILTDWIQVINMGASPEAGCFFIPEIDSKVLIAFIGKGINNPVVLGSIWSAYQAPPATEENSDSDLNSNGENNLKFIKSRSGQQIIFDDTNGEEKIQILSKDAATRFEFLVAYEMINIETDKDINIVAGGKLYIEAEEAELELSGSFGFECAGLQAETSDAIEITSGSGITLEGNAIKLN